MDDLALLRDPIVTAPDGWWRSFSPLQTRPLTWFTYWLNFQLHGTSPWGYHLDNWLLHAGCVFLVRDVLARWLPPGAALIAAGVFALHPIQTEPVAYVFSRATLLMSLFCLLAMRSWGKGEYWAAVAWFVPALLAKEECVTLPLFFVALHISRSRERKEVAPMIAMMGLSLLAGLRVLYVTAVTAGSGAGAQSGVAPFDYLLTQGLALCRYIRLLVIPYGFSIEAPLEVTHSVLSVVAWLAIATLLYLATRRFRNGDVGFWAIAAFILIAPSSTILPAADLAADRRMYLPMVALSAIAGLLLYRRPPWITYSLLGGLALISVRQTFIWNQPKDLWTEAQRHAPRKVRPYIQLARLSPPAEALALLNQAQSFAANDPRLASEKGRVFLETDNPQQALAEFGRALALAPSDALAINNRGVALARLNQRDAAIADFQRALKLDPCLFDARHNLKLLGAAVAVDPSCGYTPDQKRLLEEGAPR